MHSRGGKFSSNTRNIAWLFAKGGEMASSGEFEEQEGFGCMKRGRSDRYARGGEVLLYESLLGAG